MNLYDIFLMCPTCDKELHLGQIVAQDVFDAKQLAAKKWFEARYEELVPRMVARDVIEEKPAIPAPTVIV